MILSSSAADFFQKKDRKTKHMFNYSNDIENMWDFIDKLMNQQWNIAWIGKSCSQF